MDWILIIIAIIVILFLLNKVFGSSAPKTNSHVYNNEIDNALIELEQALKNVVGNALRYGQTVQDYSIVQKSGLKEKEIKRFMSQLRLSIEDMATLDEDLLIKKTENGNFSCHNKNESMIKNHSNIPGQ